MVTGMREHGASALRSPWQFAQAELCSIATVTMRDFAA